MISDLSIELKAINKKKHLSIGFVKKKYICIHMFKCLTVFGISLLKKNKHRLTFKRNNLDDINKIKKIKEIRDSFFKFTPFDNNCYR